MRRANWYFYRIAEARRWYAEDLRYIAPVQNSDTIIEAFAKVPREQFLGPDPWRINPIWQESWVTENDDPRHVYHNVLITIDASRDLNNGQPELWAYLFDQLDIKPGERIFHVGAGTGYYSAILAELGTPSGSVIASEYDNDLAEQANKNLSDWAHVQVVCSDGTIYNPGTVEIIIVNAGVTHPAEIWLESLAIGGRLLVPLTANDWWGAFLKVIRLEAGYSAEFIRTTGIFPCTNNRNTEVGDRLKIAFKKSGEKFPPVKSLHRNKPAQDGTCWFSGPGFWLSTNSIEMA